MGFETGYRSTLSEKLNSTDTSVSVATAPTATAGRMHIYKGNTHAWIKYTGVSGTTLTGVTFVSQTADPATTVTGTTFPAGTSIELVEMHDQMIDKQTGSKVKVYANTTARDADITSPENGMTAYITADGLFTDYIAGAWTNRATGSTPNANTTVAGKVEIATASEIIAQSSSGGSGAPLAVTADGLSQADSYIMAEACAQGDAITTETYCPALICDSQLTFGNATATQWQAFRMVGNGNAMTSINIGLKKVGTPADNVTVEIQADSSGSPSGTALVSGTYAGGSLTTSSADIAVTITSITPTDATPYWVVLKRSGALDGSNYYQIAVHTDDTVAFPYKTNNAGAWGGTTLTETHSIYGNGFYGTLAVRAKASLFKFANVISFAQSALSLWASIGKNPTRVYGGLSSLKFGKLYYLSDTTGAISLTPGTFRVTIGRAKSPSTIELIDSLKVAPVEQVTTFSTGDYYTTARFLPRGGIMRMYSNGGNGGNGTVFVQDSTNEGTAWNSSLSAAGGGSGSGAWSSSVIDTAIPPGWVRGRLNSTTTPSGGATGNFYYFYY